MTVYWTTPDELVPATSIAITCAASSLFGSAETVTVAGCPSRILAASLSLNDAVTCSPDRSTSSTNARRRSSSCELLSSRARARARRGARAARGRRPAAADALADDAVHLRDRPGRGSAQDGLRQRPRRRRERRLGLHDLRAILRQRRRRDVRLRGVARRPPTAARASPTRAAASPARSTAGPSRACSTRVVWAVSDLARPLRLRRGDLIAIGDDLRLVARDRALILSERRLQGLQRLQRRLILAQLILRLVQQLLLLLQTARVIVDGVLVLVRPSTARRTARTATPTGASSGLRSAAAGPASAAPAGRSSPASAPAASTCPG